MKMMIKTSDDDNMESKDDGRKDQLIVEIVKNDTSY